MANGYIVESDVIKAAVWDFRGVLLPGQTFVQDDTPSGQVGQAVPLQYVTKLKIIDRLIAVGRLADALLAIASDPVIQARWNAASEIAANDVDAINIVQQLGLNPAIILEP